MENKEIYNLIKKYENNELKSNLKFNLIENLIKYLELFNLNKVKLPYKDRIKIKKDLEILKSNIETKLKLLELLDL